MIPYSPTLQAIASAITGIAPKHLLDVLDLNGNIYYWASQRTTAPAVIDASSVTGAAPTTQPTYLPWILQVPNWKFYRSLQTDMGLIELQNLSGDSLQRDFEKIVKSTALEGSLFVYRYWAADAEESYLTVHGTLSVDDPDAYAVRLKCKQLTNPSSDTAPQYDLCEICQWRWSSKQCGSTSSTPCLQSFPTCQVQERIFAISNNYEKNFGEATPIVGTNVKNRIRQY